MGLLDMLLGGAPAAASAAAPASPSPDVTVTAQRQHQPVPGAGYNNMDEVNALHAVQGQYAAAQPPPDGPHTGLVNAIPDAMPGAGTLRNILGTLGDAFLVQSGHQPAYAQRQQREQIANAAAGFENDPGAAASRIAATAAPGSMQDAMSMQSQAQANDLKKATLANTQAYRDSVMGDREQNHQAAQAIQQGKADDRTRSLNGGMLAAAAAKSPAAYAQARQAALARIKPGSSIDPTEYPESVDDFNSAYGLNANQYAHQQTSASSIQERQQAAAQASTDRQRGQNMAAGSNQARVNATYAGQGVSSGGRVQQYIAKQNSGQTLTPAEQADYTKLTHVGGATGGGIHLPPGLQPQGPSTGIGSNLAPPHPNGTVVATPPQGQFSQVHTYPSGRKAGWNGHAWVPIN